MLLPQPFCSGLAGCAGMSGQDKNTPSGLESVLSEAPFSRAGARLALAGRGLMCDTVPTAQGHTTNLAVASGASRVSIQAVAAGSLGARSLWDLYTQRDSGRDEECPIGDPAIRVPNGGSLL